MANPKYVLLRGKKHQNVFWTTDDGSDHEGYEILFRGDDTELMVAEWEKYNTTTSVNINLK